MVIQAHPVKVESLVTWDLVVKMVYQEQVARRAMWVHQAILDPKVPSGFPGLEASLVNLG